MYRLKERHGWHRQLVEHRRVAQIVAQAGRPSQPPAEAQIEAAALVLTLAEWHPESAADHEAMRADHAEVAAMGPWLRCPTCREAVSGTGGLDVHYSAEHDLGDALGPAWQ